MPTPIDPPVDWRTEPAGKRFDTVIASRLGCSRFAVSLASGLLWGTKDDQEDCLPEYSTDADAALHTDHEYDVEKVLWRLLVANQQYILALAEGNTVLAGVWLNRLKVFQQLWLKDGGWYMQHPKWDTANDDIIGDITGQPGDNAGDKSA